MIRIVSPTETDELNRCPHFRVVTGDLHDIHPRPGSSAPRQKDHGSNGLAGRWPCMVEVVIACWVVLAVAGALLLPRFEASLTGPPLAVGDSDSARAQALIDEEFDHPYTEQDLIVFQSQSLTARRSSLQERRRRGPRRRLQAAAGRLRRQSPGSSRHRPGLGGRTGRRRAGAADRFERRATEARRRPDGRGHVGGDTGRPRLRHRQFAADHRARRPGTGRSAAGRAPRAADRARDAHHHLRHPRRGRVAGAAGLAGKHRHLWRLSGRSPT